MINTKDLSNFTEELAEKVANKATAKLRRNAYESGWPTNLSRTLSVVHVGSGKYSINYPEDLENDILDQEAGTQDVPPNPVMRLFMNRFEQHSQDYDTALAKMVNNWRVF